MYVMLSCVFFAVQCIYNIKTIKYYKIGAHAINISAGTLSYHITIIYNIKLYNVLCAPL